MIVVDGARAILENRPISLTEWKGQDVFMSGDSNLDSNPDIFDA